jgi:hypothetical protein
MTVVVAPPELKFSKIAFKAKANSILDKKSVAPLLESVSEQHPRRYVEWSALVEQLELHFEMSVVDAAVFVRYLVNENTLHQVPYHLTGSIAFSLDNSLQKSSVLISDEDEKQIAEQDKKYLKQLDNSVKNQRQQTAARRYQKDREELLGEKTK